jgi:hypothetical protein
MVFLNKEQILLENPKINPDVASINARLEEAERVKTIAQGLNREYSKNGSTTTLIHAERLSGASDLLRAQAEFIRAQIPQKHSPVTGK